MASRGRKLFGGLIHLGKPKKKKIARGDLKDNCGTPGKKAQGETKE